MKKGRLKKLNYLPIFQLDTITILFLIKQVEHYTEGKYDFLATVQVFWIIKNYFFGVKALIFDMLESFLFLYIFLSVKSSFIISRNYKLTDTWITQIECTQDQNNIMVDLIWWKESAEKKHYRSFQRQGLVERKQVTPIKQTTQWRHMHQQKQKNAFM